jgi:hypothetical protein
MRHVSAWMEGRPPAPPPDLAEALSFEDDGGALEDLLAKEAGARLATARARLGRVRDSAFRLLEADALLTYACEAALDRDDPETALRRILHSTR